MLPSNHYKSEEVTTEDRVLEEWSWRETTQRVVEEERGGGGVVFEIRLFNSFSSQCSKISFFLDFQC